MLRDQDNLLSQLNYNMQDGFTNDEFDNKLIQAKVLSWSKDHIHLLLRDLKHDKKGFDTVVNCDCVCEPLCNDFLVDVMNELSITNVKCLAINIVERRCGEGIDAFLTMMQQLDSVIKVKSLF